MGDEKVTRSSRIVTFRSSLLKRITNVDVFLQCQFISYEEQIVIAKNGLVSKRFYSDE